jgi:hypothetical protein
MKLLLLLLLPTLALSQKDLSRNDTTRGIVYYIKAGNKPDIQWSQCVVVDSVVAHWKIVGIRDTAYMLKGKFTLNYDYGYVDSRVRRTIKLWDGTFLDPDKFYSFISETQFQR